MNGSSHPTGPLIVLAAGGTGGHVFPAEALAVELSNRGCRLALVTDRRGGELGGRLGELETHRVRAGGVAGKGPFAKVMSAGELAVGTLQARQLLSKLSPAAVVGFGGYASVPTMLAAVNLNLRTALHEQNAVLGRANRLLAGRVGRIATSFEKVIAIPDKAKQNVVRTGMPVRPNVVSLRETPYPPISPDAPIRVLVFGGSQGATIFSRVLPDALAQLSEGFRERLFITQQCRAEDYAGLKDAYDRMGVPAEIGTFFNDLPERMAASHLVICRSGASSVGELTTIGRPAILVPYPHAIDDHQTANAYAVDEAGGGWLMPDDAFTPDSLATRLHSLIDMPRALENAAAGAKRVGSPDAAGKLADMVTALLPTNGDPGMEREAA